jgi:beta-lactamase class A
MAQLGMVNSNLRRGMKGRPAIEGELENLATSDDYVLAVQAILSGSAASSASCSAMLDMLRKQQNGRRIGRYVPEGVDWGSKTGSIAGVTNDVGFIQHNGQTLVIAVFCEGMADQHVGEEAIGLLTHAAMRDSGIVDPSPVNTP